LLSQHKHKVKPALRDSKQPRIDEMISNPPSFSIEVFEEFLVDWIVLNDQPFTEVESESFRKLLKLLKPNLKILSANTVKRRLIFQEWHGTISPSLLHPLLLNDCSLVESI
jgi:hypothetical protein